MNHCSHCGASFDGNYCPSCGEAASSQKQEPQGSAYNRQELQSNAKKKKPFFKQTWFIILAIVVAIGVIGGGIAGNQTDDNTDSSIVQKQSDTSSQSEKTSSNTTTDSNTASNNSSTNNESNQTQKKTITFTETTLIDNSDCSIIATGIVPNDLLGYSIKVLLENKSSTTNYTFSLDCATVNGVEVDPLFISEVASGKKSNDKITISKSVLSKNGITDFTDIGLSFRVHDSDDWLADSVVETTVHIYPYGNASATKFVRVDKSSDTVLVDDDDLKVVAINFENDVLWGYTVNLYILNKSNKDVMLSISDASVNGFMIDPLFATTISSGNCKFSSVSWSNSDLSDNSISSVETIEFTLRAYDANDWLASDLVNEVITINP